MPKKYLIFVLAFLLVLPAALVAGLGERQAASPLQGAVTLQPLEKSAACQMVKHNGTPASYFSQYQTGVGTYTYFDPAVECTSPTYPFQITALSFTLYGFTGTVWPAQLSVVVYDVMPSGNLCDGPGAELCRYSLTADQATYGYPTVGTFTFPSLCCVSRPFFIGLEYTAGAAGTNPSILFDAATADTCVNWARWTDGSYYEWYDFWTPPPVGYPIFWVDGETASANCPQPCTWQPGDAYKMHFPQLPDEAGWDVNATQPLVLAEDFMCTQTGWVKDVHFWGSWKNGVVGQVTVFFLSLHADIPADQSPTGYSMPGATLWEREITQFNFVPFDPPTAEGWYDPSTGETIWGDHQEYFQYDVCLNQPDWFWQDSGRIYWLNISAVVADPTTTTWGWKSTKNHWNDDAVWATWGSLNWRDLWEPAQPLINEWFIRVDPLGNFLNGNGNGAFGQGWYFYPMENWWNIWFYDHPFAPERRKTGVIEFDVMPLVPGPSRLEVAVNWSTDLWSIEQPPGDSSPPLPGVDELRYIGRHILLVTEQPMGHFVLPYEILDYNPEWVSVDVRGFNFDIPMGMIRHTCEGSMDLSFVMTGEAPVPDSGACCYDPTGLGINSACMYTTPTYCGQVLNGVYEGNNVPCQGQEACCLPNGDCVMADALCCVNELGGQPQGTGSQCTATQACCMSDGSCVMLDPLCCVDQGGVPQGAGTTCTQAVACCLTDGSCITVDPLCCDEQGGTVSPYSQVCLGDLNQNGINDACEPPTGACCYPDGSCAITTQANCLMRVGAVYKGDGTKCLGDNNQNGSDDACDPPWQPGDDHKMHYPQLPNLEGWNVWDPTVMADDWQCSETGPVKDIHFWGSWMHGIEGKISAFEFRIYSDIPASQSPTGYSVPGVMLWSYVTSNFNPVKFVGPPEGWYEPMTQLFLIGDHTTYYQYDIYIPEQNWFMQEQGQIYWLAIVAHVEQGPEPVKWGWKSSIERFNDDAVWGINPMPMVPPDWIEMREPPLFQSSLNLSFVITGETPCDCIPGDANNDGTVNVADAVYLIAFVFKGGAPPSPYRICSGDANCDCSCNVGDAVYVISYVFKGGAPPCDCQTWLSLCGPPLRK